MTQSVMGSSHGNGNRKGMWSRGVVAAVAAEGAGKIGWAHWSDSSQNSEIPWGASAWRQSGLRSSPWTRVPCSSWGRRRSGPWSRRRWDRSKLVPSHPTTAPRKWPSSKQLCLPTWIPAHTAAPSWLDLPLSDRSLLSSLPSSSILLYIDRSDDGSMTMGSYSQLLWQPAVYEGAAKRNTKDSLFISIN